MDKAETEIVFEDEHLRVIHRPGSTAYTLVTFSVMGFKPAGRRFWWRPACADGDVNALGVVALAPNWFPAVSMAAAASAMRRFLRGPVITLGYSHGGYGALKYARALGAAGAVSFSPQYSINPASLPISNFYEPFFNPALHQGMEVSAADQSGVSVILWDPVFKRDDKHVRHIVQQGYQPTELIRLPHLGHRMLTVFDGFSAVSGLFDACLGVTSFEAERRRCRHLRRRSPNFTLGLARQLLGRRQAACALRLLDAASRSVTITGADLVRMEDLRRKAHLLQAGGAPELEPEMDTEAKENELVGRLLAPA